MKDNKFTSQTSVSLRAPIVTNKTINISQRVFKGCRMKETIAPWRKLKGHSDLKGRFKKSMNQSVKTNFR